MNWPKDCYSPVLDRVLQIAMDYLLNTAQARDYRYTEQLALAAIPVVARWCNGIPYGWPTMRSWQLKANRTLAS